jgi:hypothetical protein
MSLAKLAALSVLGLFWSGAVVAQTQAGVGEQNAPTPSGTVKAIFEKYDLLGTFAWDCSKEPSQENNWYFVNRLLDGGHVQRDFMTGSTTRSWAAIIDQASELKANEIAWSSIRDKARTVGIWHVDGNRMLQWSATVNGKDTISNGKLVATGKELPWLYKCGAQTQAQSPPANPMSSPRPQDGSVKMVFEKYKLLGVFAQDCNKPPKRFENWYYVNRLIDPNHVQHDVMETETKRAAATIIDMAADSSPNGVVLMGTRDNKPTAALWRLDGDQMRQWETSVDGKPEVSGGKWIETGADMPWVKRCSG